MVTRPDREHGTHACYVLGPKRPGRQSNGCRCQPCRAANAAYEAERKSWSAPPFVSAGTARDHLEFLRSHGIGLKQVAKLTGLSHGGLSKLVYGTKTRGPSKRIRPETAEKILGVQPSAASDGTRVDATPVWRMVNEMVGAGVPKVRIAERLGQTGALQLGPRFVHARHARAVKAMYDEWRSGTLVTVHRHRHTDRIVYAPEPEPDDPTRHDGWDFVEEMIALLERRNEERAWRSRAACRFQPTWLFFPGRGDNETVDRAKRVCENCPVQVECLASGLDERAGIFGGMSDRQRRVVRRDLGEEAA